MHQELIGARRVVFFGGKGGVGKTTLASAAGWSAAENGARVLVVSTDPAHNLGHLWDRDIGQAPLLLHESGSGGSVTGVEIDPAATARHHFEAVARTVTPLMPEHLHGEVNRYFAAADASPGAHEAALMERMAQIATTRRVSEQTEPFDVVIFDTAPTGHTTRLLELPQLMSTWVEGMLSRRRRSERYAAALNALPGSEGDQDPGASRDGTIRRVLERRRELFLRYSELLHDTEQTGFVMVALAERMPLLETIALHEQLRHTGVPIVGAVVNRRSPADQGDFLAARARSEDEHLTWARERLPEMPLFQTGLVVEDVQSATGMARVADTFTAV